jgi:Leucine-rich repeat (LRR) protein
LTSLPQEIEGCSSLQKLLVQNYDLSWLPLSLAKLKDTLSEIDLSNNNEQLAATIPTEVHRDIDSTMWIISLQSQKLECIDGLKHEFKTLQHGIVGYEFDLLQLEEQVAMLEQKKLNVENDLDQVRHFLTARECKRHVQCWMEQKWEEIKLACASKMPV